MAMRTFVRSDLFRNFLGGFALGLVALVTLQPAAQTQALRDHIASVVKA